MRITILNGPNLNLLGTRQPEVYGHQALSEIMEKVVRDFPDHVIDCHQTNIEGELVDLIQEAGRSSDAIVLNAGGYTHTSVAIRDAISAIDPPVVEVHLSNVLAREDFRKTSLISEVCIGSISGLGAKGYALAVDFLVSPAQ